MENCAQGCESSVLIERAKWQERVAAVLLTSWIIFAPLHMKAYELGSNVPLESQLATTGIPILLSLGAGILLARSSENRDLAQSVA